MRTTSHRRWLLAALALLLGGLAACSDDDAANGDGDASEQTTTTEAEAEAEVLRILVTNDDGVAAPGIDALVEALRVLPDTEVVVVAPNENKSGSGEQTTPGELTVTDATTASGYPAKSVVGFPADTVNWAIRDGNIGERPDLVVSGSNLGQNVGESIEISGTVGAAATAAALGVPALAVSQGFADPVDFPASVGLAVEWIEERRAELADGEAEVELWNLNAPTCLDTGEVRGVVEVPPASTGTGLEAPSNCSSALESPANDVEAILNGFAPLSMLPVG